MSDSVDEMAVDVSSVAAAADTNQSHGGCHLPGYRTVRRLGRGGFGEVFEVEAPGGFPKAVKYVRLDPANPLTARESDSLKLIRSIRHPFLLSIDRVDVHEDHLAILMELADRSLLEEFQEAQASGQTGIDRERVLSILEEAAEALDFLNTQHNLQHLDIKPANLFLVAGHLKVGDYGLMRRTEAGDVDKRSNAVSPCYAAPELFDGRVAATTDQYSLAVVYMEMLTGDRPYASGELRQILFQQLTSGPCLDSLPASDRAIIAQALSADPEQRFATCCDLVAALRSETRSSDSGERRKPRRNALPKIASVRPASAERARPTLPKTGIGAIESTSSTSSKQRETIRLDTTTLFEKVEKSEADLGIRYRVPGQRDLIAANVEAFGETWNAPIIDRADDRMTLLFAAPSSWLRRLCGAAELFRIDVTIRASEESDEEWIVHVRVASETRRQMDQRFAEHARQIFTLLRTQLFSRPTLRALRQYVRKPVAGKALLFPNVNGQEREAVDAVICTVVDRSINGLGIVSPVHLPNGPALLQLPGAVASLPVRIVYSRQREDQLFRVGICFTVDADVATPPAA